MKRTGAAKAGVIIENGTPAKRERQRSVIEGAVYDAIVCAANRQEEEAVKSEC